MSEKPFENVAKTNFFYYSPQHREALARMVYAVKERKLGFLLLGEYGTGKTFMSKELQKECLGESFKFIFISNPRITPLEFIKEIYCQLDLSLDKTEQFTKLDYLRAITNKFQEYSRDDIYTIIIIDEAQSIEDTGFLEEIRLFLNIQKEEIFFTIIFFG